MKNLTESDSNTMSLQSLRFVGDKHESDHHDFEKEFKDIYNKTKQISSRHYGQYGQNGQYGGKDVDSLLGSLDDDDEFSDDLVSTLNLSDDDSRSKKSRRTTRYDSELDTMGMRNDKNKAVHKKISYGGAHKLVDSLDIQSAGELNIDDFTRRDEEFLDMFGGANKLPEVLQFMHKIAKRISEEIKKAGQVDKYSDVTYINYMSIAKLILTDAKKNLKTETLSKDVEKEAMNLLSKDYEKYIAQYRKYLKENPPKKKKSKKNKKNKD
jgi:hypothetical protein